MKAVARILVLYIYITKSTSKTAALAYSSIYGQLIAQFMDIIFKYNTNVNILDITF